MNTEHEERLRDALDHIARVAGEARHSTRRLEWIAARAKRAIDGQPYTPSALNNVPSRDKRLAKKDAALRLALGYLEECGPMFLDAGTPESGCDSVIAELKEALNA